MKACVQIHAPAVLPWRQILLRSLGLTVHLGPSAPSGSVVVLLQYNRHLCTANRQNLPKLHIAQSVVQSILLRYAQYAPRPTLPTASSVNYEQLTANKIHVTVLPILN